MQPRERPTVVELVGLAGVGKSTLARELTDADPALQLGLPLSRARSAGAQAAAVAPFVIPYLRHRSSSEWFTRYQVRGLGYLRAWRRCLTEVSPGVSTVVLDHGPLFWLTTLDALGPSLVSTASFRRWWHEALDDWADLLDLTVWLDAPDELLVRRIRARDQRHVLLGASDDESSEFMTQYRASYQRVHERITDRSPGRIMTLRSDCEPASVLAHGVARRLRQEAQLDV